MTTTFLHPESGDLLMCGQNHKGQLGLRHTSEVITFQPFPLSGFGRVQQVSCGWDFSIILTGEWSSNSYSALYVTDCWRPGIEKCERLEILQTSVILFEWFCLDFLLFNSMLNNWYLICVCLSGDGQVLACGSNAFGQLGVSARISHSAEPLHVKVGTETVVRLWYNGLHVWGL